MILVQRAPGVSLSAEGQLESMAAENIEMVTAKPEDAQVPKGPILHRGNGDRLFGFCGFCLSTCDLARPLHGLPVDAGNLVVLQLKLVGP